MSIAPGERSVFPLTQIVRRRLLPAPGEVLVEVGDRVEPGDIVAHAPQRGRLQVINLAMGLGKGAQVASRALCVAKGQDVKRDAPLASMRRLGLLKRQVKAPFSGIVQGINNEYLFLRQHPRMLPMFAYIPGEVVEIYPHHGVAISVAGSVVRGAWGHGEERHGMIVTMVDGPGDMLTWEQVGLRYRGAILVGGMLNDYRVLFRASQFRLNGLVLGSMHPNLRPLCEQLSLPVIITEGWGNVPMAALIFDLLRSYHGRLAVVSGIASDGSGPEVIVPLPTRPEDVKVASAAASQAVALGRQVRLTRPPYLGIIAKVVAIPPGPQKTAIGTWAEGAEVQLPTGRKVFVPYVNMEFVV